NPFPQGAAETRHADLVRTDRGEPVLRIAWKPGGSGRDLPRFRRFRIARDGRRHQRAEAASRPPRCAVAQAPRACGVCAMLVARRQRRRAVGVRARQAGFRHVARSGGNRCACVSARRRKGIPARRSRNLVALRSFSSPAAGEVARQADGGQTDDNVSMSIRELSPREALQRQQAGALLLDVRETFEHATGMAAGAVPLPRGEVAGRAAEVAPEPDAEILTICAHGQRSLAAARTLMQMGYTNVASVAGGTARWIEEGLPVVKPGGDEDFYDRYSRHLRLPEVGEAGQRKLESARVVVLGAGGLGSPAAFYLAAAGVGTLVIAD